MFLSRKNTRSEKKSIQEGEIFFALYGDEEQLFLKLSLFSS